MIPTLVIALREGVEASLIIGIIAAFLVKEGRRDAMQADVGRGRDRDRALHGRRGSCCAWSARSCPQREQAGLETVVGLVAVAAVTYMIVWMRRHARGIKADARRQRRQRPGQPARRWPWSAMAFLAVLREGFETSVFLLAAFQDASDTTAAGAGAVIGLVAAIAIGRRDLPRRRADQPGPLLPRHRPRPRLRRRRPARHLAPHRPRGGLVQRPPGPGGRPDLAGPAGHDLAARC